MPYKTISIGRFQKLFHGAPTAGSKRSQKAAFLVLVQGLPVADAAAEQNLAVTSVYRYIERRLNPPEPRRPCPHCKQLMPRGMS
jgi:hypothetical protein